MHRVATERLAFLDWPNPEAGESLSGWQGGHCAACGFSERLILDHDHETGLERGYLCRACNRDESDTDGIWEAWRTGVNPRDMYFEPSVYRNHAGGIVLRDPTSMAWAMCVIMRSLPSLDAMLLRSPMTGAVE